MITSVIIILTMVLPIAWLISEFKTTNRLIRCTLGILAIFWSCFVVACATSMLVKFNYNAHYGGAAKALINATVDKLESGESEVVLQELRIFLKKFHIRYETRANFNELAKETAERIKADK